MNWVVDIIIVVIFGLCVFLGYKKGMVGFVFSVTSFVLSVVLAFMLFNPIANVITEKTQLDETIEKMIVENFVKKTGEKEEAENMPEVVVNYIEEKVTEMKNSSIEASSKNISQLCVKVLSFIGVFVLAKIIIAIVGKFADVLTEMPVLKQFNEAGGTLIGALNGLLIIYLIFAILSLLVTVLQGTGIYSAINQSYIGSFMYNHNLLLKIIF